MKVKKGNYKNLVIVGNGFDLWQNLPTSYEKFRLYYKEILSNYRKQIYELDIERIQEYADIFPKRKMISEALSTEVF